MGVSVRARPCLRGRASRSRVLLLATLALGCTSRAPSGAPRLSSSLIAQCRSAEGNQLSATARFASLRELMTEAINPSLSVLSVRLFHDPRAEDDSARGDEVAAAADRLAACFAILPEHFAGPAHERADIEAYAALGKHNSRGLQHAAYQRDRKGQLHWYMHIKELCTTCHNEHRRDMKAPGPGGILR